jgi:sigma-E factor negative regulatory protein RseC
VAFVKSSSPSDADMVEQTARVVRADSLGVWVEPVEPGGCGTCGDRCGARRLAEVFSGKPRNFPVQTTLFLQPGDRVIVGVPAGAILGSALRLYGLPLALMLVGALVADAVFGGDFAALGGLLAGGALALVPSLRQAGARPVVLRKEHLLKSK